MAEPQVAFVAVATEGVYDDYARRLAASALDHAKFESFRFHILAGVEGPWPTGTLTRPQVMLDHWNEIVALGADYVYCIDSDMLVTGPLDDRILGEIVATEHPGYVGHHRSTLPYDRSQLSRAYVPMDAGDRYFCGGLYGGEAEAVHDLLEAMAWICEGPTPRFHDESALNFAMIQSPPSLTLSPSYCHPDRDDYYREHVWQQDYERIIVALDKTPEQRGIR